MKSQQCWRKFVEGNPIYVVDLVLISETMEELRKKFYNWKRAFERKGRRLN